MRLLVAVAALVLWFAWPALAGLDSVSRSVDLRNADGIAPSIVRLAQSNLALIDLNMATTDTEAVAQVLGERYAVKIETVPVAPTPESFDGSWTASDNNLTIHIRIRGTSIEGRVVDTISSAAPPLRFDGKIEPEGRVDFWVSGRDWAKRKLVGIMSHLKLLGGGVEAGGADFNLRKVENY